jgi:hypothetical protein
MRTARLLSATLLLLVSLTATAQEYNPFKSIGKKAKVLTLSKGKYAEFFDGDTIQRIGTVLINIRTRKIVKLLNAEQVYKRASDNSGVSRWYSVDPLAEKFASYSPYNFVENNPINRIDPDGKASMSTHTDKNGRVLKVIADGDLGIYRHNNAKSSADIDNTYSKTNTSAGGQLMGRTLTPLAFYDKEYGGVAGKINFGSTEAMQWQNKNLKTVLGATDNALVQLYEYASNAGSYEKYDYKTNGLKDADGNISVPEGYANASDYMFRGSQVAPGIYLGARDVGNYFAGQVASAIGMDKQTFLIVAGMFELSGNSLTKMQENFGSYYKQASSGYPFYGEKPMSNIMQRIGYEGANTPEKLKALGSNLWID